MQYFDSKLMDTKQRLSFRAETRAELKDRAQSDQMRMTAISNFTEATMVSVDPKKQEKAETDQYEEMLRKACYTPRVSEEDLRARKPMPYDILTQMEFNGIEAGKKEAYQYGGRFSKEELKNYVGPRERMLNKIEGKEQRGFGPMEASVIHGTQVPNTSCMR